MLARRFILAAVLAMSLGACGGGAGGTESAGGRIAFTVNRDGFGEIWVMSADGGGRIQLTESVGPDGDAVGSTSPAWSPDGKLIAYASSGEALVS